jgi:curved DNA-binding protein CbpA
MTRDEALRLLGLDEDATETDIRLAYREMAQILHPDKYVGNKKLAERASEQFKHVNEAREVLLGKRTSRQSTRRSGTRRSGGGSTYADGATDRAAALRARLVGIAAARVQLTAQLDAELDHRRVGLYLALGGLVAALIGRFIRPLLALAPVALVWGIVQVFSAQANIKVINGHLAELERGRKKCEQELEEL